MAGRLAWECARRDDLAKVMRWEGLPGTEQRQPAVTSGMGTTGSPAAMVACVACAVGRGHRGVLSAAAEQHKGVLWGGGA